MKFLLFTLTLALGTAGWLSAHAVVRPDKVGLAQEQTFVLSVLNEEDTATTKLRLVLPAGVTDVAPTTKPGWTVTVTKSGDQTNELVWTGSLAAGFRDEFSFSAKAPEKAGTLLWKTYQSYGTKIVAWDLAPDAAEAGDQGPASATQVVDDLTPASKAPEATQVSWLLWVVALVSLVLSIAALAVAWAKRRPAVSEAR